MAANSGMAGLGALIQRGDGASPEAFTSIGEVQTLSGPSFKVDTVESTHLSDVWKQRVATLIDGGEVKFTVNWIPANTTQRFVVSGLGFDLISRTKRNFKVQFADGTAWRFAAFVTGFDPRMPKDGIQSADFTLMMTDQPVLA
jgi:hypothetical protein